MPPAKRTSMSIRISPDLARRVRRYCADQAGAPGFWSVAKFSEVAFSRLLTELERSGPICLDEGSRIVPRDPADNHRPFNR